MKPWTSKPVLLGIAGSLLLLLGILLCLFSPLLFHKIIQKELPLTPNSRSFNVWKNTSTFPVYLNFYFFNWTNPEEITIPDTKPNLVQVGPYSFREIKEKMNVVFHPENSTVSYLQRRWWYFDEEKSNGSLSDNITQLNVVAVSAAHMSRRLAPFMQSSLSLMLQSTNTKIHIHKTVDQLLFTGYRDSIIDIGKLAAEEGQAPPFDRFGWFYKRNGSTDFDGYNNMATGEDDVSNLGVLKLWNHKDTIKDYKSPCNTVEGSAGEFWPPYRTKDDIKLFSADICRPLTYEFVDEVTHKDIGGYKFAIGKKTLSNDTRRRFPHEQAKYFESTTTTEDFFEAEPSTVRPQQSDDPDIVNMGHCYCNGKCSPMGLINITACRYGAPGFVSLPHFFKADPVLRDQITGMNPKQEEHDFYITLEPNTGIPIDVSANLQVNILLQPSKTVSLFNDVPTIYFPILWFSLKAGIPDDFAVSLGHLLMLPKIGLYVGVMLMFLGSLAIFIVAVMCYMQKPTQGHKSLNLRSSHKSDKKTDVVYFDKNTGEETQCLNSKSSDALDKKVEVVYTDKTDDAQVKIHHPLYPTA